LITLFLVLTLAAPRAIADNSALPSLVTSEEPPPRVLIVDSVLDFEHEFVRPFLDIEAMKKLSHKGRYRERSAQSPYEENGDSINWLELHDQVLENLRSKLHPGKTPYQLEIMRDIDCVTCSEAAQGAALVKAAEMNEASLKNYNRLSDYLHGTHVSALVTQGYTPHDLRIIFFPIFDVLKLPSYPVFFKNNKSLASIIAHYQKDFEGELQSVSDAIQKLNIKVVNMSFGKTSFKRNTTRWKQSLRPQLGEFMRALFQVQRNAFLQLALKNPDTVFIKSAGNGGENLDLDDGSKNFFSKNKPKNVLFVASLSERNKLASNSNFGKEAVDLAAYGVRIKSACMNGGTIYASGTSMAAPVVSGKVAKHVRKHPNLSAQETIEHFLAEETEIEPCLKDKVVEGHILKTP